MFTMGMTPSVFTPEYVFKYDVIGTDNRDGVQYQIMRLGKKHQWAVINAIGTPLIGYETAQHALQALEAHLNETYGFITPTAISSIE